MAQTTRAITRSRLWNGFRILTERVERAPLFAALLCVEAGSRYDPASRHGLSAATAGTLLEGAGLLSSAELALSVESLGAEIDVAAGYETVTIATSGPAGCLDDVLAIVLEIVRSPRFARLETVLDRQRSEIAEERDDPYHVCQRALFETIYGCHPRAHSPSGDLDGIAGICDADVRAFHERRYVPDRCTLAIVGDVDPESAGGLAATRVDDWRPGGRPSDDPLPPRRGNVARARLVRMACRQTHLCVGHLGIPLQDPRYEAFQILDAVLGDCAGFGARLAKRLRESEGLAYVVESDTTDTAGLDPGLFRAYTATSPESVAAALGGIREEIAKVAQEAPSSQEVEAAVAYLIGRRLVEDETIEGRAARLLRVERYGLGLDSDDSYADRLASIRPQDVHSAAKSLIDLEGMSVVAVGPSFPSFSI